MWRVFGRGLGASSAALLALPTYPRNNVTCMQQDQWPAAPFQNQGRVTRALVDAFRWNHKLADAVVDRMGVPKLQDCC